MEQSSINTEGLASPGCLVAAVSILGDKWTAHIIRALADQSLRFCRLQDAVGGVNPRTLSARLTRLEDSGIIMKTTHSAMPPHTEYTLSEKGRDLLPILEHMAAWSNKYAPAAEK